MNQYTPKSPATQFGKSLKVLEGWALRIHIPAKLQRQAKQQSLTQRKALPLSVQRSFGKKTTSNTSRGLTKHYLKIQSVEVGNDAQYPNAECSISPSLTTETPGSYCNAVAYLNEHQD